MKETTVELRISLNKRYHSRLKSYCREKGLTFYPYMIELIKESIDRLEGTNNGNNDTSNN